MFNNNASINKLLLKNIQSFLTVRGPGDDNVAILILYNTIKTSPIVAYEWFNVHFYNSFYHECDYSKIFWSFLCMKWLKLLRQGMGSWQLSLSIRIYWLKESDFMWNMNRKLIGYLISGAPTFMLLYVQYCTTIFSDDDLYSFVTS